MLDKSTSEWRVDQLGSHCETLTDKVGMVGKEKNECIQDMLEQISEVTFKNTKRSGNALEGQSIKDDT